jgi:hypothetical protein
MRTASELQEVPGLQVACCRIMCENLHESKQQDSRPRVPLNALLDGLRSWHFVESYQLGGSGS